jgi:TPR repeat protein
MALWAACLKQGVGAVRNLSLARELYLRAADAQPKGDLYAMHNYARMCQLGEGGPVDLARAYKYFEMAARLGATPSKIKYAELTLDGPVELPGRDFRQAKAWLEDCVRDGVREAANMLRRRELSGI